jgi:hypothetical protein
VQPMLPALPPFAELSKAEQVKSRRPLAENGRVKTGDCGAARGTRLFLCVVSVFFTLSVLSVVNVRAQQIFRWTDEAGTIHFGDQPPPNAKGLEAETAAKTQAQMECEAAVRQKCFDEKKFLEKSNPNSRSWVVDNLNRCLDRGSELCEETLRQSKPQPTQRAQRYIATATLHFDPAAGESLKCEMRCHSNCRGPLEIRTDRVLKRGENYGSQKYSIEVKPEAEGSAFCSVTTNNDDVQLVLGVVQDGRVTRTTEAQ